MAMQRIILATIFLCVTVSGQTTGRLPGEIINGTGITVPYLVNAAGGIWQQERVIDSMAYACTEVIPYLASKIPDIDASISYWGPVCDKITEAAEDLDNFNAEGACNDIITMFMDMSSKSHSIDKREAVERPGFLDTEVDIIGILETIVRDLYGIEIRMIIDGTIPVSSVCTNIKENFLEPSLEELVSRFGAELLTHLLPHGSQVCREWTDLILWLDSNTPPPAGGFNADGEFIEDFARIASQAAGYDSREELCEAISTADASTSQEVKTNFGLGIFESIFGILTDADRCILLGNAALTNIVEPVVEATSPDVVINSDLIYTYTGFRGVEDACNAMQTAFSTEIDLPDPDPIQLFPGTDITVDFFLEAAGGVWQQTRTIDSMAYECDVVIPEIENRVPNFSDSSRYYDFVCEEVRAGATDLVGFDATASCNRIMDFFTSSPEMGSALRRRRQAGTPELPTEDGFGLFTNVLRDFYGIDINDVSTVCPNIKQFLAPSLADNIQTFAGNLMTGFQPFVEYYVCSDWAVLLSEARINQSSPFYEIIVEAGEIGAQLIGYSSRNDVCERVRSATSEVEQMNFGSDSLASVFDIFTNVDRCVVLGNAALDDVIEPILNNLSPDIVLSSSLIYRYTGYRGVEEACTAMQTAFSSLFGSIVELTVTGESLNGEALVYTPDLANRGSTAFKQHEMLFCRLVRGHLTQELGNDLRKITCRAVMFSQGSIVAELELEVLALTQDSADSLAIQVEDLSSEDGLILSSDGDVLTVSAFSATATNVKRGLSVGAIVGIAVACILIVVLILVLIGYFACRSGDKNNAMTMAEKGKSNGRVGAQNPGYQYK